MAELRNLYSILIIIVVSSSAYAQNNERILFEHYSAEAGLSHIGVNAITQDSKGFLWIGTYDGLNRFDGYKFRVFRYKPGDTTSLIHNRIHSIIETHGKLLWIGTEEGVCIYDPTYEKFSIPAFSEFSLQKTIVHKLFEDSKNRIWILSNNNIYIIGKDRKSFRNLSYQNSSSDIIIFSDIKENAQGYYFVASNSGLITINPEIEIIKNDLNTVQNFSCLELQGDSILWLGSSNGVIQASYQMKYNDLIPLNVIEKFLDNNSINDIRIDRNSTIWVGLQFNGLARIKTRDNKAYSLTNYKNNPEKIKTLSNDRLSCIFEDRQGILWFGTSENGINKFDPSFRGFRRRDMLTSGEFGLKSDYILSFIEYGDNILIGTRGRGIFVMDKEKGEFIKPEYNFDALEDISVSSLFTDSRNILWIGTWRGLYRMLPGENEIEQIDTDLIVVYDIIEDEWGNIWLGTRVGLKTLSLENDFALSGIKDQMLDIEHENNRLIIRKIYSDPFDSALWVGTWHNGLLHLTDFNNENKTFSFKQYKKDPEKENALKSDFVTSIIRINKKDIWVGTEGGGLSHGLIITHGINFNNYFEADGISNNVVKRIIPDKSNNLWITTNNGLNKFSIAERTFKIYEETDGIASNYFTNAGLILSDNTLLFGGNKGLTVFDPNKIRNDTIAPIPELGSIQVSYQTIAPLEKVNGKVLLDKSISETEHIELAFNQNTFSFELLGLQFTDPLKNRFKYMLKDFDQDWIYSREGEFYANYTKVKPGKYTFIFFAANSDGLWSPEPKTIDLTINPPFWRTGYAYSFYTVLIIFIFIFSLRLNKKIVILKHNVKLEKIEAQKKQELTEAKVKFFMNVSHEFKTPITLIKGPLQWLSKHYAKDGHAKSYLSIIKDQADYLINLLEQLVYFRKAESATLELKCRNLNIISFIDQIIMSYQWQAEEQRIELKFIHPENNIFLWFDPKKMEKVFHNLISNAFKYTNPGGKVKIILNYDKNENIVIKVMDTGKGISKENIEHIFERFYQVDSTVGGYGIGLSLTKSLIDLHQGKISVESAEGKGTKFEIELKSGSDHLTEKQMIVKELSPELQPLATLKDNLDISQETLEKPSVSFADKQKEVILIVEDNLKMLSFIEKILARDYKTISARHGKEALELIDINLPDLIISDVMMPEMDGITLLKRIKGDIMTCHIPVILLTAKGEMESRIEGLEEGADHYIPKPFDVNLLLAEVKSIIHNRNKIKERIRMNLPFDLSAENVHPMDQKLLEKITHIVSENYNNADFDSTIFSKKVFINRSQFFKKMKALTNQTPTEFIREYRMNKAVEFMLKDKVPISEVNYKVGISSRSYFTKCFKEIYGASPSDFLKKKDLISSD